MGRALRDRREDQKGSCLLEGRRNFVIHNQSHRRQDVALTANRMLKWKKRSGRYGYKHVAETLGYEFEIEKQITDGRTKKHWHLIIIRKGVYGANRIAANGMVRTVKAAKDQAGEFMKNEGANKI